MKINPSFAEGFLDGFSGIGLFMRLRRPGTPDELFDSRSLEEFLRSDDFLAAQAASGKAANQQEPPGVVFPATAQTAGPERCDDQPSAGEAAKQDDNRVEKALNEAERISKGDDRLFTWVSKKPQTPLAKFFQDNLDDLIEQEAKTLHLVTGRPVAQCRNELVAFVKRTDPFTRQRLAEELGQHASDETYMLVRMKLQMIMKELKLYASRLADERPSRNTGEEKPAPLDDKGQRESRPPNKPH